MEISLETNDILTLDGDQRGMQLRCVRGRLWLTEEGDPRDYLLGPGQFHTIGSRGRVVVWALTPAAVRAATAPTGASATQLRLAPLAGR